MPPKQAAVGLSEGAEGSVDDNGAHSDDSGSDEEKKAGGDKIKIKMAGKTKPKPKTKPKHTRVVPKYKRDLSKPFDVDAQADYRDAMSRAHKREIKRKQGTLAMLCGCCAADDGLHINVMKGSELPDYKTDKPEVAPKKDASPISAMPTVEKGSSGYDSD
jgi:hypothetical protein